MIKDKITSELKNRLKQEIDNTIEDGKEHGFLLCSGKKEKLSATRSVVGDNNLFLKPLKDQCDFKIQGDFHTHPHANYAKKFFDKQLRREIPIEDVKNGLTDAAKKKNISLTEPSYGDILGTMVLNYKKEILGTTCVGTDIEPEKVECWSIKGNVKKEDFDKVVEELDSPAVNSNPLKWVRPLFEKEIIDLRDIRRIDNVKQKSRDNG